MNDFRKKAAVLVRRHLALGASKKIAPKKIRSFGTLRSYIQCVSQYLEWRNVNGLLPHNQDSFNEIKIYLDEFCECHQQKTVCQHRMALGKIFNKKIPPVKSQLKTVVKSRIYSMEEVLQICEYLPEKYRLSVLICYWSGLRAHELATLTRCEEATRSDSRDWRDDLFHLENDYSLYIVSGKGGLKRYIAIPNNLATELESRRLETPKVVKDRGINYKLNYDVGFGQSLSQYFSKYSLEVLGFSCGLHGLRHTYTQNRIRKLLNNNVGFDDARLIVSQELGHFRPEITNCYIR